MPKAEPERWIKGSWKKGRSGVQKNILGRKNQERFEELEDGE